MMRFLRGACALLLALCLGFSLALIFIEQDPLVEHAAAVYVRSLLESAFRTPISLVHGRVRIFSHMIRVTSVTACPHLAAAHRDASQPPFGWRLSAMHISISLWKTLRKRLAHVSIEVDSVTATSTIREREVAIIPHILQVVAAAGKAAVVVEQVCLHSGTLCCTGEGISSTMHLKADVRLSGTIMLWFAQGMLRYQDFFTMHRVCGIYSYHMPSREMIFEGEGDQLVGGQEQHLSWHLRGVNGLLEGELSEGAGTFRGTVSIDKQKDTIDASFQSALPFVLLQLFRREVVQAGGLCEARVTGTWSSLLHDASVAVQISDATVHGVALPHVRATMVGPLSAPQISYTLGNGTLAGECAVTPGCIRVSGENTEPIVLPGAFSIPSAGLTISGAVTAAQEWNAQVAMQLQLPSNEGPQARGSMSRGSWRVAGTGLEGNIYGTCGEYRVQGSVRAGRSPVFTLAVTDAKENQIFSADYADEVATVTGDYRHLEKLLQMYGIRLPGEGTVHVTAARVSDAGAPDTRVPGTGVADTFFHVSVDAPAINIRLPYSYNLLERCSLEGVIDMQRKLVRCTKGLFGLHKGNIELAHGSLQYTDAGTISFVHAPIIWTESELRVDKELYTVSSGALFVRYDIQHGWHVDGCVMSDRMYIKNNILSSDFFKRLPRAGGAPAGDGGGMHCSLNMRCLSRRPLHVKSSFLDAQMAVTASLSGKATAPQVRALITVTSGTFLFPYKPLFITRGIITVAPHNEDDPLLDIVAENTINGYQVRLQVSGSVKQPHIEFTSNPSLPQEQIIGLLWGGSDEGALYGAMSASILQMVERLIFGASPEETSRSMGSLSRLFRPLGSVRFVPSVTDQTARGGLRGSLVIEVNDRLRGIIKQNFDLSQDTLLEVEYALSDDARVRAFKDERGDLGGEIEASWKF